MLVKIVEARHVADFRVWLRFDDGAAGEVDLSDELWGEVFEPLRDVDEFAKLRVDDELDTIVWPNGADLSPAWLRTKLKTLRTGQAAE